MCIGLYALHVQLCSTGVHLTPLLLQKATTSLMSLTSLQVIVIAMYTPDPQIVASACPVTVDAENPSKHT